MVQQVTKQICSGYQKHGLVERIQMVGSDSGCHRSRNRISFGRLEAPYQNALKRRRIGGSSHDDSPW
jgi:hypothetical protein